MKGTGELEKPFESIFDVMPDPSMLVNAEGTVLNVSASFVECHGFPKEEIVGKNFLELKFVPDDTKQLVRENLERGMRGEKILPYEVYFESKSGIVRYAEINAATLEYKGKLVNMIVLRDITERKQAEDELRASEERYRSFFENANDLIQSVDANGKFVHVNRKWREVLGYSQDEISRLNFMDVIHQGYISHCMEIFEGVRGGDVFEKVETVFIAKDGREIHVEGSVNARFEDGEFVYTRGIFRDVTEHKRTREELRESEEKLRIILDNSNDMIVYVNNRGKLLDVNKKAEDVMGYSRDELIGKNFAKLGVINVKNIPRIVKLFIDSIRTGKVTDIVELELKSRKGNKILVEAGTQLIKRNGKTEGAVSILRDITKRKQAEELFRTVAMSTQVGTYIVQRGKFVFTNPIFQKNVGFGEDELLGMPPLGIVHPEDRETVRKNAVKMLKGESSTGYEFRIIAKDGRIRWAYERMTSIEYRDELAALGSYMDITEKKRMEEKIEHFNAILRAIRNVSQLIARGKSSETLLQDICGTLVETQGYYNAWIALLNESGELVSIAEAGLGKDFLPMAEQLKRGELTICGRRALEQSGVVVTEDPFSNCGDCPLAKCCSGRGAMTVGLEHSGKTYGLLSVSIPIALIDDEEEQSLFQEVAGDIAFALRSLELEEKRKQAEDALQREKAYIESILHSVPDMLVTIGSNREVTYINDVFARLVGVKPNDVVGKPFEPLIAELNLIAPESVPVIIERVNKRLQTGEPIANVEIEIQNSRGERVPVLYSAAGIEGHNGEVLGEVVLIRDITERKQSQRELQESEERYRTLFENSPDFIAQLNREGRFISANSAMAKSVGMSVGELVGKNISEVIPKEVAQARIEMFRKVLNEGLIQPFEDERQGRYFHSIMVPLQTEGKEETLQVISRDVTERKRMEQRLEQNLEELQATYQKLQEVDKMKDSFLSTVSHELRTPLTSIKGFAEILLTYEEDRETQREFLTIINEESERLTRLINDFLDISRIEAGRMQWQTTRLAIPEIIETAINATQALYKEKNQKVEVDLERDLPSVWSDSDRLVQVITNVLSNAIKFTPDGGEIRVAAQLLKSDEGENAPSMIRVSVSDTGIGIAPEDYEKIFEKFKQVGDTLTDRPKGTGLGLPICKEIVEHYGGKIWVESELDKGSTFYFTLPVREEAEVETPEVEDKIVTTVEGSKTILVVDDEANVRRFLKHELTNVGHRVVEASGGKEAIDLAKEYHPDLITLDIIMPDINGFDVTAVLKNDPGTKDIPILILSVVGDKERGYQLGASDYVTKPFNSTLLIGKITQLLGRTQKKVLVADDDKSLVKALEFELKKRGFSVCAAYDGKEALKMVEGNQPDLIVLDIVMPEIDGYEVMKILKGNPDTANIPIIVLTGVEIDGGRVKALSLGAAEYVTKSGGLGVLFATIEDILSAKSDDLTAHYS